MGKMNHFQKWIDYLVDPNTEKPLILFMGGNRFFKIPHGTTAEKINEFYGEKMLKYLNRHKPFLVHDDLPHDIALHYRNTKDWERDLESIKGVLGAKYANKYTI